MTRLCELAVKHETDKSPERHNYTPIYSYFLQNRVVKRMLEVGIGDGQSLRMWEEYFPNAEIWGADHEVHKLINVNRIHSVLCDQRSEDDLRRIEGPFDFIVDDASHHPDHQITSARIWVPLLSPNGLYIIEDISFAHRLATLSRVVEMFPKEYLISQIETSLQHGSTDSRLIVIEKQ
jgi:trans-aconitate methyltransferase